MKRNKIFLSYRRDDSPGYVSRLEGELERAFGKGRVFRDANDIRGGTKWKQVIDENLSQSAVLLLIIGPRWEPIWEARKNDAVNYVALELERARELNVPVVPVSLDGVTLSNQIDLGNVSWILDNQFHDLSDRQSRWEGDFSRLVRLIESVEGMGAARTEQTQTPAPEPAPKKSNSTLFKVAGLAAAIVVVAMILVSNNDPDNVTERNNVDRQIVAGAGENADNNDARAAVADSPSVGPSGTAATAYEIPNIGGTWQGRDGTYYDIQQRADGSFDIQGPGDASGRGQFYTDRPRKFAIEMGTGRGEFSVSAGDQKIIGWIEVDGRQKYDTLIRVE